MLEFRDVVWSDLKGTADFDEWVKEYAEETTDSHIPVSGLQAEFYDEKDAEGVLFPVCAYDGGKVVGVAGLVVSRSGHYPFPIVSLDTFYLRKAWRQGSAGLRFIRALKKRAAELGAPGFVVTAHPGSAWDKLCERQGMTHLNNLWWCSGE